MKFRFIVIGILIMFLSISISCSLGKSEIKWYSFEEGIDKAKKENKLILMDIYAKWCHWCNVMENTTYKDKEVIELINKYYIPVRVDAEERPDLNKRYNQGGLPSTLIIDKNGNEIFGAIYLSAEEMKKLLIYYKNISSDKLEQEIKRIKNEKSIRANILERSFKDKDISLQQIEKSYNYIKLSYDYEYGGLIGAPKFPRTDIIYFLMLYNIIYNEKDSEKLIKETLKSYEKLIDKVEGGIFRYSVTEDWNQPHYEKLLKDQAQLSILFFNSFSLYDNIEFLKDANDLINFAKDKLYDKKSGYFYNSQGADIVDEKGNILMTGEEYFKKNKEGRQIVEKALGYSPRIEKDIYFANNSLMASALIYSSIFNNNQEDLQIAKRLIENIIKDGLKEKGISHSKNIEKYFLATQIYFLDAVLNLYQADGNLKYLKIAENIFDILDKYYFSKELRVYVDLEEKNLNLNKISFIDDVFNLNSNLIFQLYKLSSFTGEERYFEKAKLILKKLPVQQNLSTSIGYFVYFYPPLVSHIAGYEKDKEIFTKALFKVFPYYHYPQFITKNDKNLISKLGYNFEDKTTIYVCNNKICFKKFNSLNNIKEEIMRIFQNYKKLSF